MYNSWYFNCFNKLQTRILVGKFLQSIFTHDSDLWILLVADWPITVSYKEQISPPPALGALSPVYHNNVFLPISLTVLQTKYFSKNELTWPTSNSLLSSETEKWWANHGQKELLNIIENAIKILKINYLFKKQMKVIILPVVGVFMSKGSSMRSRPRVTSEWS